jgi:hypothetical protein
MVGKPSAVRSSCRRTIARGVPRPRSGASLRRRWGPYRTVANVIEGVVLTFVDVTNLKHAEEAARGDGGPPALRVRQWPMGHPGDAPAAGGDSAAAPGRRGF